MIRGSQRLGVVALLAALHGFGATGRAQAITTVAGNGVPGFAGDVGPATSALLHEPRAVAVDIAGNLFIADTFNFRVRKVTPTGVITTFAGNGSFGNADGISATSSPLTYVTSVAVDSAGSVFIAECGFDKIQKVSPAGTISTLGDTWNFCGLYSYPVLDFRLAMAGALAVDSGGNLFVANTLSSTIRKVTPAGVVTTVAGNGTDGFSGDGGPATSARLYNPYGIAIDPAGNLFIADSYNNRIRKVTPAGIITTVTGNGNCGASGDGGPATAATVCFPTGLAVDTAGNLYIAETSNRRIRKIAPTGIITTVAGNSTSGSNGDGGPATSAALSFPMSVAVDARGNLFIADTDANRIRKVNPTPTILSGVAPNLGAAGATVNATLTGLNFIEALTIDAGSGITVTNVQVISPTLATATLTIAADAALSVRALTVTNDGGTSNSVPFQVVAPFPDLSITSAHSGTLSVGFNTTYTMTIGNDGLAATAGAMTVTDTLTSGLAFVSGAGDGWSCSASSQTATCVRPTPLVAGASTALALTLAVTGTAPAQLNHSPVVSVAGDLVTVNNTASDAAPVARPSLSFNLDTTLKAGAQSAIGLNPIPLAFPEDVTGTLSLAFTPDVPIPADDPAIQFMTGGRQVAFMIPANTVDILFAGAPTALTAFQTGTLAGTLTFIATLRTGAETTSISTTRVIPRQAPTIHSLQTEAGNSFAVNVNLSSTAREVTRLVLTFHLANPDVRLTCGVNNCVASGNTLTFDVKALFDKWFISDKRFGSLSVLRLPMAIQGVIGGTVDIQLGNGYGLSNSMSFSLP